ncbi:hypothetical protein ElyMa_002424900 [Elysia marginata]|uniref:Uncharacterized protein n=1 Tax=Elysia marginata TaxID=1093978 RepID=A0AAV4GI50_9GAST|nr:hypothetical protein ElyMa_002424900 [Elysia marginata]
MGWMSENRLHVYSTDGQSGGLQVKKSLMDNITTTTGRPQKSRPRRLEGCCGIHLRSNHRTRSCRRSAVSMVKLDVEEWEWVALPQALSSHALDEVSQLLVELHVTIKPQPKRERYLRALLTLTQLYRSGFRIFYTRRNLHCSFRQIFDGTQKTGCHEVHMVKVHSRRSADSDHYRY